MKPAKDEREKGGKRTFRKSLRNTAINYRNGWFFVTCQVAHNKSIFGAIVGERCELNPFGLQIKAYWRGLPAKYPELELDEFVLMPNHFHAIVRIHYRPTNKEHHLGFLMSRFKGGAGYIYGKLRRAGEVEDIGEHLWQFDYWDKIVTDERQLEAFRRYIRDNPKNWSRDRFGAVTQYSFGNLELLRGIRIAFVASQGFWASELRPRLIWKGARDSRAEARRTDMDGGECEARRTDTDGMDGVARRSDVEGMENEARRSDIGEGSGEIISVRGASAPMPAIISTFTSAQEREALRRALARGRRVIQVIPQGIPRECDLPPDLLAACREGRALLLSPQPPNSRLNKKVATWCNEYVLRHASEIWAGDISPNGMLASMLKALGRGPG
jgi:REP element-mobilizing transposase RayT